MEKIGNNIELVSLHIPKTAGTAFRTVLQDQYGKKRVARVDIQKSGRLLLNEGVFDKPRLNKRVKVVHGHFSYRDVLGYFDIDAGVKFITWLRDPAERVVSNYFFLRKIMAGRLGEKPGENLLNRMGKSLAEFASSEENRNVMSKFISREELKNFDFVGMQGEFESELKRLAVLLDWKVPKNRKHNVTGRPNSPADQEVMEHIRSLNQDDEELYKRALELKKGSI